MRDWFYLEFDTSEGLIAQNALQIRIISLSLFPELFIQILIEFIDFLTCLSPSSEGHYHSKIEKTYSVSYEW